MSLVASPPDLQMDFVDPRTAGAPQLGLDITLVRPSSRGDVRLRSANPHEAPMVSLNALATEADVTALVQGVRLARLVGASPQLDRFRGDEAAASRGAHSTPELQAFVEAAAAPAGIWPAPARWARPAPPTPSSTPVWPCTASTACTWSARR